MITVVKNKNIKWWIGRMSCVLLFGAIILFAYSKTSFLMKGVSLDARIEESHSSSLVEVKGRARGATYVTLNGREIFIDKEGLFNESLILLPGLSVVTLESKDKFGKTSLKKFEIVYNGPGEPVAINK
jgi:hypothetical protein